MKVKPRFPTTSPTAIPATYWKSCLVYLIKQTIGVANFIFLFLCVNAQPPVRYDILNRQPLEQIGIKTPQPATFAPITPSLFNGVPHNQSVMSGGLMNVNPMGVDQQERNRMLLQEADAVISRQNNVAIEKELMQEQFYREHIDWLKKSAIYREAFKQMDKMFADSFSLTQAVYLTENAFLDNMLSYPEFSKSVQVRAGYVRQIIKREKLDPKNNVALNYGIQKMFSQPYAYYNSKTKQTHTVPPFRYRFDDYMGEKEYENVFAAKALATSKGQCHSMPLVYLMIAEQLGTKAWLSLAPQHSFIRFADMDGNLLNFETTNGTIVSTNWLTQSGFINATALKTKAYLDTLSQKDLFAQCLADLLLGYLNKFEYDAFSENIRQRIQQLNPNNMTALMVDAGVKTKIALNKINAAGKPPEDELPQYPEAYRAYLAMHEAYEKVDGLGYQDMPKEAYQKWLKSIDREKKKQENIELNERMRREIEHMKKYGPKSTLVDRTRG